MFSELVQLNFDKILQTHSYTVVIMASRDKKFAIYMDPSMGKTLQLYLTNADKPRPLTHDLIAMIFKGFNVRLKQVVINDLQDTVYFARLFLEINEAPLRQIVEIDARPSDCIILALKDNAPVYITKEALEKTLAVVE